MPADLRYSVSMMRRPPFHDEGELAVWRHKRSAGSIDSRSVIVAHTEAAIGESIALLLRLKGFVAVTTSTMDNLRLMLGHWKPRALLIDTRLCRADDFLFIRRAAISSAFSGVLIIAMTNVFPFESPEEIKRAGFDGLCRRPCPVWRLADVLDMHLRPAAGHD